MRSCQRLKRYRHVIKWGCVVMTSPNGSSNRKSNSSQKVQVVLEKPLKNIDSEKVELMVKTEITTQNDLVTNSTRGIRKQWSIRANCHTKCLLQFRPSYKRFIGIPVKDISYNLNGCPFPLILFFWGGGEISSSYNDNIYKLAKTKLSITM